MKQIKVVFPAKVADKFAAYLLEHSANIRALISWGSEDFFGTNTVTVICAATEEQATAFKSTEFNQFIK